MRVPIVVLCIAACGGSEPESRPPEPTPQPPPAPAAEAAPAERLRLTTDDGFVLDGDLHPGDPELPVVVLLHQLSSDRREWGPEIEALRTTGATIVAFDMRGHAQSVMRGGELTVWRSFEHDDWAKVPDDLDAMLSLLKERGASRFVLVGSSIGSSACIVVAARRDDVAGVVALSPGRAYRGIDVMTPASNLQVPLLAIAAEGEAPAKETAEELARVVAAGEAQIVGGTAHGVRMRAAAPDLAERITRFVRRVSVDG